MKEVYRMRLKYVMERSEGRQILAGMVRKRLWTLQSIRQLEQEAVYVARANPEVVERIKRFVEKMDCPENESTGGPCKELFDEFYAEIDRRLGKVRVRELPLSDLAHDMLLADGVKTIGDLAGKTTKELLLIGGMRKRWIGQVQYRLGTMGLRLGVKLPR